MNLPRHPCTSERGPRRIVLLVEDEPFVREATCRILQSAGFYVLPAADAQEAMQVYEQSGRKIDLLMTDMVLPGRSGRQLGQDLRRTSPMIPILLTSGYLEPGCETESVETHTYYLPKPYSRAALVEKMEKIFSKAPLRRAATQAG
jgi:two-component system cell cycle sensor histidine kinase/response regulator CckA